MPNVNQPFQESSNCLFWKYNYLKPEYIKFITMEYLEHQKYLLLRSWNLWFKKKKNCHLSTIELDRTEIPQTQMLDSIE